MKSLSRLLGSSSKPAPALHLAAFGKHPGWNDHLDDLGLDTDALITAKRLLYVQGISQNIDSGAWDKIEPSDPAGPPAGLTRLEQFRHNFLWHLPTGEGPVLLAGRLWSSSDGKGRAKYPMVLCAQQTELPDRFAAQVTLPLLAQVHERCAAATTADAVREILSTERDTLRARIKDSLSTMPLTARELFAVASHAQMHTHFADGSETVYMPAPGGTGARISGGGGFHRIAYQFARGMSAFRTPPAKNAPPRRPEQVRLPVCGMPPADALLFWYRFALTFVDAGSTPLLLFAPDQGLLAPWVDLIAGEPAPGNLFCIKAGPKTLPYTSDIPYTLDQSFVRAIDTHVNQCNSMPEGAPMPAWTIFQ